MSDPKRKVFLVCSVRGASQDVLDAQMAYVSALERDGFRVHYPPRDTNQEAAGINICTQNCAAISDSDEVHVWYSPDSQGTHFDMGVAFAFGKPVVVARNIDYGPGKSYARMLDEWSKV